MSKFVSMWKYFRDELRFPLIQDVGPLAQLAQGGGDVLDEVRELVYWLRRQLNPETCEDAYVANHARSRVIVRGPHETWSAFRTRVAQAYHFHWLAGKHNGMPQILELMGYPGASLINWRGQDPEKWAEFWCSLLPPADQEFRLQDYDQLFWILNEYKPARSRLVSLRFEHQVETDPPAAVGLLVATGSRFSVMFGCDPAFDPASAPVGLAVLESARQTVTFGCSPSFGPATPPVGVATRHGERQVVMFGCSPAFDPATPPMGVACRQVERHHISTIAVNPGTPETPIYTGGVVIPRSRQTIGVM